MTGQHNLPEELTSLIGRDRDRLAVHALLDRHRVVTLTGVGGVGKTRVALSVARDIAGDFADGLWFIELAALERAGLVAETVGAAIGVAARDKVGSVDALIAALGGHWILLVLDNCEHVIAACAEFIERIVRMCPHTRIMATSRETLGVSGEVIWPVLPLPVPDGAEARVERLREVESVRLLVERAQAGNPEFSLTDANAAAIAEVCRRLDGLPLALELAAARMKVLAPEQLVARLDDRFGVLFGGRRTAPARQRSLEAMVAWSYDLLDPSHQALFDRVCVFGGSFSLEAAEAVCAQPGGSVLEGLSRLVDQSMVLSFTGEAGEQRYTVLETLRALGRQHLRARDQEHSAQRDLARWIAAQAQQAANALRGIDQARWLRWAEQEHDNVRTAVSWACDSGDVQIALQLACSLWWSWLVHGHWIETEEWLERALSLPGAEIYQVARARVLHAAGTTAALRGRYAHAHACLTDYMSIVRHIGKDDLLLDGHSALALVYQFTGDPDRAQPHVQAMLDLAQRLDRPWYRARAAAFIASRALKRGDLSTAAGQLAEAAQLARASGDLWNLAMLLSQLGDVERMRGTHPRAAPHYQEALRLFETLGLQPDPSRVHNLGYVELAAGRLSPAESRFREALDAFQRVGDPRGVADCLIGLGCVRAAQRRPTEAARLFGVGEEELARIGSTVWPSNRADYQRWTRVARGALGADVWAAELTAGRILGAEAVLNIVHDRDIPPAGSPALVRRTSAATLTHREREVAELAATGLSNRAIAEVLTIAEKTAANHLQNALDKLEVHSRSQLAARAVELGLASSTERIDRRTFRCRTD